MIRILLENGLRLPLGAMMAASDFEAAGVAEFFADRLKVMLRDKGARHDLVDAVFALGDDDLVRVVARIEALAAFLATEDGANLLAGYKRAGNILAAEAKKGALPEGKPSRAAFGPAEEAALFDALVESRPHIEAPVDAFFDKVLVNSPDLAERANRLALLGEVRDAMGQVADFSLVSA